MRMQTGRRSGLSRTDLLALLIVTGLLAGLLLPALVQAQLVGGKSACINNLKQIGIAIHSFHDAFQYLPTEQGNKAYPFPATSFYTQILPYVEQKNADPKKPTPIKLFMCSDRHQPNAPYRDYVYVSITTPFLGNPDNGVSLVLGNNLNGASNTALLSHIWMERKNYTTDKATWADKMHSVKSAVSKPDSQENANGLGSPHMPGNPYLFADGHVQSIAYGWNEPKGAQEWMWNWKNTNNYKLP